VPNKKKNFLLSAERTCFLVSRIWKAVFFTAFFILLPAARDGSAAVKPFRGELDFSLGLLNGKDIGIIKSIGWYVLPRFFKIDINIAYVDTEIPFSGNISLHLPLGPVVPFGTAGLGFSFQGNSSKNLGGGIKFKLSDRFALLGEYRWFRIVKHTYETIIVTPHYFGAGVSWFY
jgi:hypothetical protein